MSAPRFLFVALVLASSCRCSEQVRPLESVLEVSLDSSGPWASSIELDLGEAWGPQSREASFFLRNAGTSELGAFSSEAPADLAVAFEQIALSPSRIGTARVILRSDSPEGASSGKVRVLTDAATATAEIVVTSNRLKLDCQLPDHLDFGAVVLGQHATRGVAIANPTSTPVELQAFAPLENGSPSFVFTREAIAGTVLVPARGQGNLNYLFRPLVAGASTATVQMQGSPACPLRVVELRGVGITQQLSWAPAELDAGWVAPGDSRSETVTFTNHGSSGATVTSAQIQGSSAFSIDWTEVFVPAGMSVERSLVFAPTTAGVFDGRLSFTTDLSEQPTGQIDLSAGGGGPSIHVAPSLAFGLAASVSGTGVPSSRSLVVSNVGGPDEAPDEVVRLRINGLSIQPRNGSTAAGEFFVTETTPLDIERNGLAVLQVQLRPMSLGVKEADLVIESNDVNRSAVSVRLSAEVKSYAPCSFSLNETGLEFGVVHATNPMTRSLMFRNTSASEPCLVFASLSATTPRDYSLPPSPSVEVAPEGEFEFPVRLQPRAAVGSTVRGIPGELRLQLSSVQMPEVAVPLSGAAGPGCLGVLERDLHFGAVAPGSQTPFIPLRIINHCAGDAVPPVFISPLTLRGVELTGDVTSFRLQFASTIPDGGLTVLQDGELGMSQNSGVAPRTQPVQVAFAPGEAGLHRGAVVFEVEQDGRRRKHVVPLWGRGDLTRAVEDSFLQAGADDVDIVVVVSGDFSTWVGPLLAYHPATRLRENADVFIRHLLASDADFRVGLVNTATGSGVPTWRGIYLVDGPDAGPVITRQTVDPVDSLRNRLGPSCRNPDGGYFAVCPTGGGQRMPTYNAWRAVTEPNASRVNGGPLRADARLSVITFTDRAEYEAIGYLGWNKMTTPGYPYPMLVDDSGDVVRVFQELKGVDRPELLSIGGLTGISYEHHVPGGLCDFDSDVDVSPMYVTPMLIWKAAARAEVDEICPPDAGEMPELIERMAEVASGLRTHFRLSAPVDANGEVSVLVDGVVTPQSDAQGTIWTLQPSRNEVRFALSRTPRPGQKVAIRYLTRP